MFVMKELSGAFPHFWSAGNEHCKKGCYSPILVFAALKDFINELVILRMTSTDLVFFVVLEHF